MMEDSHAFFLILLMLSPVIIFIIHLVVGRIHFALKTGSSPLVGVIWSIGIGFIVISAIIWYVYLPSIENPWKAFWLCFYGAIVFCGLATSYFILFAMTEAARRIRIMWVLYQLGETTLDDVESRYGAEGMLSARLERMAALGQLKRSGTRYYMAGRLLYFISKVVMFWSRLLKFSD